MNKKLLNSPYLFQMVKEFTYTYDIPMHNAVGSDADLKEHILEVFRNKMVKDLITTIQEADELLVPLLTELTQTEDPKRMCYSLEQKLQFYKFLIHVDERIYELPDPVTQFSIRGMRTENYNGQVGDIHARTRTYYGKKPDKVIIHEPDMEREK